MAGENDIIEGQGADKIERDPDHFSPEEIAAVTGAKGAAAVETPAVLAAPAAAAAAPAAGQQQQAVHAGQQQQLNQGAAPAFFESRGFKSEREFDMAVGAMVQELRQLRQRAGGTPALQQQLAAAGPKLPKTYWEALGQTPEVFNARGTEDPYGVFGELNAHFIQNHPAVQTAIETRVQEILKPFEERFGKLEQFKQGNEVDQHISTVGGQAKTMMDDFISKNPELQKNAAAKAEFAKIISDEIEDIYFAVENGRNPFNRIAEAVLWKHRGTLAEAQAAAANQRMKQTGAALAATPKPGAGATQMQPANRKEKAYAAGRQLGVEESILDAFAKAAEKYDD